MNAGDKTPLCLLRRAAEREPDAWQRLVTLYSPLVSHWCLQLGLPEQDQSDVVREVFAAVVSGLRSFCSGQPGTTFRGWLRGIARHTLQDYFERRREPPTGGTDAQRPIHEAPSAATEVELFETEAEITALYRRALSSLQSDFEERTWKAFWQVAVEDRTPVEVAAEMGITANAVRLAKSRVLRRLKEELGVLIA